MFGRYVSPDGASIEREFNLVRTGWQFPPSFNVAPPQDVPVVRVNEAGEHTGSRMHWGPFPSGPKASNPNTPPSTPPLKHSKTASPDAEPGNVVNAASCPL